MRAILREEFTLVEVITQLEKLKPSLRAGDRVLSGSHLKHKRCLTMNILNKEAFVGKLIPKLLKEIKDYSTTL